MNYLFVFVGGGAGSIFRYLISQLVIRSGSNLPLGTLVANIFSCLLFAAVTMIIRERGLTGSQIPLLLLTGFCGGLSTFSAFGFETYLLLKDGQLLYAVMNVLVSTILCLAIFYSLLRN